MWSSFMGGFGRGIGFGLLGILLLLVFTLPFSELCALVIIVLLFWGACKVVQNNRL